jgi:hypothetical protein
MKILKRKQRRELQQLIYEQRLDDNQGSQRPARKANRHGDASKRTVTEKQRRLAWVIEQHGIASKQEIFQAFERGDDDRIFEWKQKLPSDHGLLTSKPASGSKAEPNTSEPKRQKGIALPPDLQARLDKIHDAENDARE